MTVYPAVFANGRADIELAQAVEDMTADDLRLALLRCHELARRPQPFSAFIWPLRMQRIRLECERVLGLEVDSGRHEEGYAPVRRRS